MVRAFGDHADIAVDHPGHPEQAVALDLADEWPSTTPLCDQVPLYAPSGQSLLLATPLAWFWNQVPAVPALSVSTSGRRVGPLATAEQLIAARIMPPSSWVRAVQLSMTLAFSMPISWVSALLNPALTGGVTTTVAVGPGTVSMTTDDCAAGVGAGGRPTLSRAAARRPPGWRATRLDVGADGDV